LFGWDNDMFSNQRWGMSLRYFKNISGTLTDQVTPPIEDISSLVIDTKYRISQGVWGRDPSMGLVGSLQMINIQEFNYSLLGAGAFWARSMPKFFAVIMDIIPWFRYPKWVDVEFIYYPMTFTSNYVLGSNYALNFHGKIQWPKHYFGEAGFGLKQYSFSNASEFKAANIYMLYATIGLGYTF
jgi:hypothetical protein